MVEKPKTSWEYVPKAKRVVKSRVKDLGVIFIECLRAKAKKKKKELKPREWENIGGNNLGLGEVSQKIKRKKKYDRRRDMRS